MHLVFLPGLLFHSNSPDSQTCHLRTSVKGWQPKVKNNTSLFIHQQCPAPKEQTVNHNTQLEKTFLIRSWWNIYSEPESHNSEIHHKSITHIDVWSISHNHTFIWNLQMHSLKAYKMKLLSFDPNQIWIFKARVLEHSSLKKHAKANVFIWLLHYISYILWATYTNGIYDNLQWN